MRRHQTAIAISVAALLSGAHCGPPDDVIEPQETTASIQHKLDVFGIINSVLGIGKTLYDFAHVGKIDEELNRIISKIDALEPGIRDLQKKTADLSYWVSWDIRDRKESVIESFRLDVKSFVTNHNDRKAYGALSNYDENILRTADQLTASAHYYFPGATAGAADRFEYRFAMPTYILAVDSWFAVRASTGKAWNDSVRSSARNWASHLDGIADTITASIYCVEQSTGHRDWCLKTPNETHRPVDPLDPDPIPCNESCKITVSCYDHIEDRGFDYSSRTIDKYCGTTSKREPVTEGIVAAGYGVPVLRDRANLWRSMIAP